MRNNMHGHAPAEDRSPLAGALNYESFLENLGAKDRVNAERHVAICEAEADPRHAILWRRLACRLMTLAGHSAKLNREPQSAQFYVADGKYRMQIFALEDGQRGGLSVYCGDVLDQVIKCGVLVAQESNDHVNTYCISDSPDTLIIERLDGKTLNPAAYFKEMLGWNRKAIRVSLPIAATASQVAAVEDLCGRSMAAEPKISS